ncbi:LINE-1 retrotransposable element ORF2 protein [Linum perenne]
MLRLFRKQRGLKSALKRFNSSTFSDISKRVTQASLDLASIQVQLLSTPSESLISREKQAVERLLSFQKAEESFFRQKARIRSISEGDSNTSYFHRSVKVRTAFTTIRQIQSASGVTLTDPVFIVNEFVSFYKGLLGTEDVSIVPPSVDSLKGVLNKFLSHDHCDLLCKEVTREEIRSVMFKMDGNRSPGPDGYNATFYKRTWGIIEDDFVEAVLEFFSTSRMLPEFNVTSLTLIPKVANPSQVREYRPISCCSLFYKCIAKLLAVRMQLVLPDVISASQSGFVKGRKIVDNILLAQELVRMYNRTGVSPRSTIKIDLMKAFDSVHWGYLFNMLFAMGFPDKFIGWLRACVVTASYSVSVNGGLHGFFPAKKGVRQGDPLSPYLFVIAIEGLSRLLDIEGSSRRLPFHPQCLKLKLTHLAFADDMMIFSNGSVYGLETIVSVLEKFAGWSGLKVNPDKCEIFSAGIPSCALNHMRSFSGFSLGVLPVRYLGLPLIANKLTLRDCDNLIQKITLRIRGWSAKTLSFAGRLQLVNAVLLSLSQFWMSVFPLPLSIIKRVQQLCASYLWGGDDSSGKKAKVAWTDVTFPKQEGGLGLRDMKMWNQALVFRLLWDIFACQGSIWVAWLRHYRTKGRDLGSLSTGSGSWVWRRLLKHRAAFLSHFSYGNEMPMWDNISYPKMKISVIWESIRAKRPRVPWFQLVWGFGNKPSNSFIAWLYILGRLSTKDRLIAWGIAADPVCFLCSAGHQESHSHLFFECEYSLLICKNILGRFAVVQNGEGAGILSEFCQLSESKGAGGIISRTVWTSVVAHIWRERCTRAHGGCPTTAPDLAKVVLREVALQALGNATLSAAIASFGFSLTF